MTIASPNRVSTEELRQELDSVLSLHFGAARRICRLRRRRSNYSSSCAIENLELELDGGNRLSLVFKDISAAALLEGARQVRPDFLYNPRREIETYRVLLDPELLGTAICYGTIQRPELGRYWLFLERVEGPLLWQMGRLESWKKAAQWIARLHNRFRNGSRSVPDFPQCLLRYDQQYYLCWLERAERFLAHRRDSYSPELLRDFRRLAKAYECVTRQLLSLPQTFIHGEFYPSNVILRRRGTAKAICPIDWEVAAVGPGLMDLAALISGNWTPEQKQALVRAYVDALEPGNGWPPPIQELLQWVNCCQLHLAVQWLGWARDWTPPKSHAQDWLVEAVGLARRSGILGSTAAVRRRGFHGGKSRTR